MPKKNYVPEITRIGHLTFLILSFSKNSHHWLPVLRKGSVYIKVSAEHLCVIDGNWVFMRVGWPGGKGAAGSGYPEEPEAKTFAEKGMDGRMPDSLKLRA